MSINTYKAQALEALDKRAALVSKAKAVAEDKGLTVAEKRTRIDAYNVDISALGDEARSAVEAGEREAEVRDLFAQAGGLLIPGGKGPEVRMNEPMPPGASFADLAGAKAATDADFGKFARGLVYGESRAATEGVDSAGGFIVPTTYAATVLDLMRNQTQVIKAGASLVPCSSDDNRVAKVNADPSPAWRNESSAIASGDITFGEVVLKPKSLAVLVKASMELVEDASNFGAVLAQSLAGAFAVKLDSAAMYGSGVSPEPLGIKGTPGVTVTPLAANGAALTNYDPMVTAVRDVRAANFTPGAMIAAERTAAKVGTFKDTQGQYLTAPAYLNGVDLVTSGNVPTNLAVGTSGAVTSDIFVGDWSQLFVGVRTAFSLKVLNERFADTGEVGFIGWLRADVQVARTAAFQVVSGINAS